MTTRTSTITEVTCDGCGKAIGPDADLRYRIEINLLILLPKGRWAARKNQRLDACSRECTQRAYEVAGFEIGKLAEEPEKP